MAPILRNGGSESPDRWLNEPRNNQKGINLLQGLDKITKTLQEPEKKNENLRQVKEKARESIRERLARGKTEADRINRERMQCEGKIKLTTKKEMEL